MNKKLFCIIGKSATGKDTIYTQDYFTYQKQY